MLNPRVSAGTLLGTKAFQMQTRGVAQIYPHMIATNLSNAAETTFRHRTIYSSGSLFVSLTGPREGLDLGEPDQKHQRTDRHEKSDNLISVDRLFEDKDTNTREQEDHRDCVNDADGCQLEMSHDKDPTNRGRCIETEPQIEPVAFQWLNT